MQGNSPRPISPQDSSATIFDYLLLVTLVAVASLLTLVCADWVARRVELQHRVMVCVSGWRAEDDGTRLRMVRPDGDLVPCGMAPRPPAVELQHEDRR